MARLMAAKEAKPDDLPLFIAYFALITLALVPIYFGAYQSLRTPAATLKARKEKRKKLTKGDRSEAEEEEDDEDDEAVSTETLTSSDAWLFPVIGSCVLFSMYLVFKFLDRKWVDRILGGYFFLVGIAASYRVVSSLAATVVGREKWKKLLKYRIKITHRLTDDEMEAERKERAKEQEKKDGKAGKAEPQGEIERIQTVLASRFSTLHVLVLLPVSLVPVLTFHFTRHWLASNFLALCLSLNAISLMGLDSFVTGSIMLGGLFLYDIFWVFGTEVMVSVARNFEAGPIKIVFPKNLPQVAEYYAAQASSTHRTLAGTLALLESAPKWQMTMLGLGDIVIPGIFIALALRFDQHLHLRSLSPSARLNFSRSQTNFAKPYFTATLTAYIAGLVTTMAVMHTFKAAQPALLYLSPACVLAVVIRSLKRGEWAELWKWKDEEGEEEDEGKKDSKKE
ncbi:unnamed protein product [Jaminaea pallidilutea]